MIKNIIQKKNITYGLIFKAIAIVFNLALIPLLILYLGKTEYGVWVTVFSVVNWILMFDIGIGTGLRNKLTEALAKEEFEEANAIISTSYILITFLALVTFIVGVVIIYNINGQNFLNYYGRDNAYIEKFIILSLFFTVINFVLSLYKKLYLAIHKSYIIELVNVLFLLCYYVSVYTFLHLDYNKSLIGLMLIFGSLNILMSFISTLFFFTKMKNIEIHLKYFNKELINPLLSIGSKFFVINMSLIIILFTDNIIISRYLGPSDVTDYSVVQRIFQLLVLIFNIILASSWSLYSDAIIKKEYSWIRKNLKKMNLIMFFISLVGFIIWFFIKDIIKLWLGKDLIIIPYGLAFGNLLYFIIFSYSNIYMYFINATGKIKIQMYLYIAGALANIPLSIFFVKKLDSSTGVIIATIICLIPLLVVMPLQAKHILSKFERTSELDT